MKKNYISIFKSKNILYAFAITSLFSLTACTTSNKSPQDEDSDSNQSKEITLTTKKKADSFNTVILDLQSRMANLEKDNTDSKILIASLKMDVQSQKEELQTQKKNIAILKRGLRSGIFEEFPEDTLNLSQNTSQLTMLPDFVGGSSGFVEGKSPLINSNIEKGDNAVGANQMLANAEIKIRKGKLKEGLMEIEELKKKFPNYEDEGRSFLLSAQAWLKLKEYNNALPALRSFYLRYPSSAELAYAKLLEGQATEGNGSFEKAAVLYSEVVALSPQSALAQTARNGMLRMRDAR